MPTPPTLYDFEIGSTLVGLENVEILDVPLPPPTWSYKPYQQVVVLGSQGARGIGYPSATWSWASLTDEQRDQLRELCAGASSTVFIRTRTNENTNEYKEFRAVMNWPTEEVSDSYSKTDFSVLFTGLVEQT
jgi:hypothetical protein